MISSSFMKAPARVITLSLAILLAAWLIWFSSTYRSVDEMLSDFILLAAWLIWFSSTALRAQGPTVTRVVSLSAASYSTIVAPEQIVAAFGTRLATTIGSAQDADPGTPGIQLPTLLSGTSLEVNGRSAGLLYISPGQINYVVPPGLEPGTGYVIVRGARGEIVASGDIEIRPNAPAIFTANTSGAGVPAGVVLRVKADGAQSFEPLAQIEPGTNNVIPRPIDLGPAGERVFLLLFLTGARRIALPTDTRILIGGAEYIPAFIGPAPGFVGLEQLNFELPRGLNGRVALALAAIGYPTSNICEIEVAPPAGAPPRVSSLSVTQALAGERIEIVGSGFSSTRGENEVLIADANRKLFNAQIAEAATTSLKVNVPFGAGTGNLIVRTPRGESAYPFSMRTSVSGIVQAAQPQPNGQTTRTGIRGVTVRAFTARGTLSATTNNDGSFLLADVPTAASTDFEIDGTTTGLNYPKERRKLRVHAGRDNQFGEYIELKQAGNVVVPTVTAGVLPQEAFSAPASANWREHAFTGQTGQVVFEPNGSTAQFPDGTRVNELRVTALDPGRTPADLPAGQFSSTIVQLTPFGARLTPGGKLTFPNTDGLAAGSTATLYRFDQTPGSETLGRFVAAGSATVSADGQLVETARDAIKETTYYFVSIPRTITTVYGSVTEEDATPARGALVQVRGQSIFALTDQNGAFILANVPLVGAQDLTLEVSYLRPDGTVDRTERSGVRPNAPGLTFVSPPIVLPGQGRTRAPVILAPKTLAIEAGRNSEFTFIAYARVAGQTLRSVTVAGASFAAVIAQGNDRYALRLTPAANVTGTFMLTLSATDSQGLRTDEAVVVEVRAPNNPAPIANSQSVTTDEDTAVNIVLTGSNGNVYRIVSQPRFGTLSRISTGSGSDRVSVTYTPARDFNGADSFSFTVSNGVSESAPATVSIAVRAVNDAPRLEVEASYTTNIGQALSFVVNGFDADAGQKLTLAGSGLPTGATITQTTATSWLFNWTPKFDQLGSYPVNLSLRDDGTPELSVSKTVTIVVAAKWAGTSQIGTSGAISFAVLGNMLFAGTYGHGVFRTTDNGVTWTAANGGLGDSAIYRRVFSLGVKDNALFAGTEGGVFRSTDNGVSWTAANNGLRNQRVNAWAVKDNVLFAGTAGGVFRTTDIGTFGGGVFRSTDQGQSWSPANPGLPPAADVRAFTPSGNGTLAGLAGEGVFFSNDQGRTWSPRNVGLNNRLVNALASDSTTVYAGTNGGVFRSFDGGATWVAANMGLTRSQVLSLTLSGSTVYAGTDNGLFRSTNQGASWTEVSTGLTDRYIVALGLAPDGTTLLAGTSSGLFRSSSTGGNQGQSWTPVTQGLPERVVALTFAQQGRRLLAGTVNGFFVSEDNGASWRQINGGLLTLQVGALAVSGNTVLAGTRSGGVFVSQLPQ